MTDQMEPDRFYQVWRSTNGKTHGTFPRWREPSAFCRHWWPNPGWERVPDNTPITCGSCLRSVFDFKACGLVRGDEPRDG